MPGLIITLNCTRLIVMLSAVHGTCGSINPCMEHDQCSKKYPEQIVSETQLRDESLGPTMQKENP